MGNSQKVLQISSTGGPLSDPKFMDLGSGLRQKDSMFDSRQIRLPLVWRKKVQKHLNIYFSATI